MEMWHAFLLGLVLSLAMVCCLKVAEETSETIRRNGYCVMYGQCPAEGFPKPPNCVYNGPAKPMQNDEAFDILHETCPHLTLSGRNNTKSCCDLMQLRTLKDQLQTAQQLLSRCPSCLRNFYNLWCQFTCSPDQSTFLDYQYDFIPMSIYYLTGDFANGLFHSCVDVVFPGSNGKVLDYMCGTTAKDCTTEKFLNFVGQPPNAPFQITPIINATVLPENVTNMDISIHGCNSEFVDLYTGRNLSACSCQDCRSSCPVPPAPPAPTECKKILGICRYYFIIWASTFAWLILFWSLALLAVMAKASSKRLGLIARSGKLCQFASDPSVNDGESSALNSKQALYGEEDRQRGCIVRTGIAFEYFLQTLFQRWGTWCAYHPWTVIFVSFLVLAGLSLGLLKFKVVTDPVDLWSAPGSEARQNKNYFDEQFSPFYRTEQVIITAKRPYTEEYQIYQGAQVNFSGIVHKEYIEEVLALQSMLMSLTAVYNGKDVRLEDICFQPLSPDNNNCTVFSVAQFWQNSVEKVEKCIDSFSDPCGTNVGVFVAADWHTHFLACTQNPSSMSDGDYLKMPCMSMFGAPVPPKLVLGGFEGDNYSSAESFIITFVVNNHEDKAKNKPAEAWEKVFIEFLHKYKAGKVVSNTNLSLAFSSERSIQDELDRESSSDISTILLSYLLMFAYIAVGLGQFRSIRRILVDAKIVVGLVGVLIVLLSVTASLGTFSFFRVPATLIIIEVVPFLVLAVGVDNIFILVQALQRDIRLPSESVSQQVGRVLGMVGPSMLLSSLSEAVAFGFGALSTMPAVNTFSMYASLAVGFNFFMQITILVAVVALDFKRETSNRFDMFCCFGIDKSEQAVDECFPGGVLFQFMKKFFTPFILLKQMRVLIITVFSVLLALSISVIPRLDVGLDQRLALPTDSFLVDYFKNMNDYLKTGAPVYFVVKEGYNYTGLANQNRLCGGAGCNDRSLVGDVFVSSEISSYSKIALPASSWIDDYYAWADPSGTCCRVLDYKLENRISTNCSSVFINGTELVTCRNVTVPFKVFPDELTFCSSTAPSSWICHSCLNKTQMGQRPNEQQFRDFLPWYLSDNPNTICAKGGHPSYGSAVKLNPPSSPYYSTHLVNSTYFMSYHTVCKTSQEYTAALKYSRELAKNMSSELGHEVFAYSVFYLFYEQYLTIVHDTWVNLLICLAAIFFVTFLLMGFNFGIASIVSLTVAMIVTDLMGIMYLWGISLNAVSLVNLTMATGISVEFCSHVARAFSTSPYETRVQRSRDALSRVGSSVLSGITFTKFVGIAVLAFAKSQLFEVFYFRMYAAIIVVGATHGLIFLPALLSFVGPASRATESDRRRQTYVEAYGTERQPLLA